MRSRRALNSSHAATVGWLGAMVAAMLGCEAEGEHDDAYSRYESAAEASPLDASVAIVEHDAATPLPDAKTLREPGAAWVATVSHNGTGCIRGTLDTRLALDGKTFGILFSSFEASVGQGDGIAVKNCQLEIALQSPTELSYAVDDFFLGGFGFLEPRVQARASATYGFRGSIAASHTRINGDTVGPFDDMFELRSERLPSDQLVWSPCGTEAQLSIGMSVRLQNSSPRGQGYLNSACLADGCRASVGLRWKACGQSSPPEPGGS